MALSDMTPLAMGAGGAGLVFSLAGLLIRSLFNAASNDKDYREEIRKRDEAREAELAERKAELAEQKREYEEAKHEFEVERKEWRKEQTALHRRVFELEAKVNAQDLVIAQLTGQRGAA